MNLKDTTDEELTALWHKQAREMSFFNCAEGESWYKERVAREACSTEFRKINEELRWREIPLPQGNYLC
jgi:hypothetical protein